MPQKIFFISLLIPLSLIWASCKSAYQLTPCHIDQQTSQTFMAAAHTLVKHAQNRQAKVETISSNSDSSLITTAQDTSKKKKLFKSLRFKKQKIRTSTSSGMPNILALSDTYTSEDIIETYMQALSLYTSAYESQTSSMRIYLKTKVSNAMNIVKNISTPASHDAQTTLLEAEYEHIWNNATNILCDPYTLESVLFDIKKRMQHLKKEPNADALFMLLHSLHWLNKKSNPYQGAIIRSYAHEILKIIQDIKSNASSIENKNILKYWSTTKLTQLDFDDLIQSLQERFEHSSKLCKTSSAQTKKPFRLKLLEEQINMLKKLLLIHKNCDDIFKCYWIAKEAQKIRQLVMKRLPDNKGHTQWKEICSKWHGESDDLSTVLKYVMQCIEIPKEHVMAFYFNALPILIDIYQRYVLPPPLLQKITVPMRTILDLLSLSDKYNLALSNEQETIIEKAHFMTCTLTRAYSAKYHCIIGDQRRTSKRYADAKKHFIIAARDLLNVREQNKMQDPNLMESGDHLYISLLQLFERKIPFSENDISTIIELANAINIKAPPQISLQREVVKLTAFLEQLNNEGLLKKTKQQASCSSNNQK